MSLILKHLQPKLYALTNGLFANWLPENAVAVGDFGILKNGGFERCGSLVDFGVTIDAKPTKPDGKNEFEYKDKVDLSVKAAVDANLAPKQGAKVALTIKGKGAFLYHISDVSQIRPTNQRTFEEQVARALLDPRMQWNDDFVLVTEVQHAAKATIIASDSAEGKLELNTTFNPTGTAFLSGAKGGVSVGSSFGSMFSWIARSNTITLLKLVRPVTPSPPGSPQKGAMMQMLAWAREILRAQNLTVTKLVIRPVARPDPTVVVAVGSKELFQLSFSAVAVDEVVSTILTIEPMEAEDDLDQKEIEVERRMFGQAKMTG